jgi:histidinol-phosphate aminotransferase
LPLQPRKSLLKLAGGVHGGIDFAELYALGLKPDEVLDFSVSTNPYMPPPGIKEAVSGAHIERYPDSQSLELKLKLAEKLGIATKNIIVGNGTTELIRLVIFTYFRRSDTALIIGPTYGEYETACRLAGACVLHYRAAEKDAFQLHVKEIIDVIRERQPRAVFICNPNNPTGSYLSRQDIETLLAEMANGLMILDEAYVPFIEKRWRSLDLAERGNIIILRSMTKDYGLPGLRLGYAAASQEIIDGLRPALPPWNVNAAAQEAGLYVLGKQEYLEKSLRRVEEAKNYLVTELTRLGLEVLPSEAHFFLVKVKNAAGCRRSLLAEGILVRDCSSFGLPHYIRIAPRTLPECRKLAAAFRQGRQTYIMYGNETPGGT